MKYADINTDNIKQLIEHFSSLSNHTKINTVYYNKKITQLYRILNHATDYESLFREAIENFPYELLPTFITLGEIEPDSNGEIEYKEEFTFEISKFFSNTLDGGGWIEIRKDEYDCSISAFMGLALNENWESSLLPEYKALIGEYDSSTQTWNMRIDSY